MSAVRVDLRKTLTHSRLKDKQDTNRLIKRQIQENTLKYTKLKENAKSILLLPQV